MDVSEKMSDRIRARVYAAQAGMRRSLSGKYVIRGGVKFLVVKADPEYITVSDTKTAVDQHIRMKTRSFLSRRVEVLED